MLVVAVGILVGWRAGLSVSVTRAIILSVLSVLIYEVELGHTVLHGQEFVSGCTFMAVMPFLTSLVILSYIRCPRAESELGSGVCYRH